jgi:hypothetical protein
MIKSANQDGKIQQSIARSIRAIKGRRKILLLNAYDELRQLRITIETMKENGDKFIKKDADDLEELVAGVLGDDGSDYGFSHGTISGEFRLGKKLEDGNSKNRLRLAIMLHELKRMLGKMVEKVICDESLGGLIDYKYQEDIVCDLNETDKERFRTSVREWLSINNDRQSEDGAVQLVEEFFSFKIEVKASHKSQKTRTAIGVINRMELHSAMQSLLTLNLPSLSEYIEERHIPNLVEKIIEAIIKEQNAELNVAELRKKKDRYFAENRSFARIILRTLHDDNIFHEEFHRYVGHIV